MKKLSLVKYLIVIIAVLLIGCENNNKLTEETILWEFHPTNHQEQWDLQAFQLINEFQAIQNNFNVNDTLTLKTAIQQLINTTDTLIAHTTTIDSLTQNTWMAGLQSFRNELEALILEPDPVLMQDQWNMSTIAFIHFLADIGYAKTNVYIFQITQDEKEIYWVGDSKTSKNPFDQKDRKEYKANFTLQEP